MAINGQYTEGNYFDRSRYEAEAAAFSREMRGRGKKPAESDETQTKEERKDTLVYVIDGNVYMNITNRCSNSCDFCVRNGKETYCDYSLWLKKTPTAEEMLDALAPYLDADYEAFVFCGFGEPLYALDTILKVAPVLKAHGKCVRLNTNGQADLITGINVDELAKLFLGKIDVVSISLNAPTKEAYQAICHSEFGEDAFNAILRFAAACTTNGIATMMSVVDVIGLDAVKKCADIARIIGAEFRCRDLIE